MIAPLMLALATLVVGAAVDGPEVEPTELATRADLIGREVVVDDRVRFFSESKRTQGFDEIHLRRTEVPLRLPARLRYPRSPTEPVVRARGVLVQEGARLVFDVRELELLPADPERLEAELRRLRPGDFVATRRWGLWAQRRGKELNEPKLAERGVELEGDALWAEGTQPEADALTLAEQAAGRPVSPIIRNALLHRGFRDLIRKTDRVEDREALLQRIARDLPESVNPRPVSQLDPAFAADFARDPASTYRTVTIPVVRAYLDRQLWADLAQMIFEQKVRADPAQAGTLADAARKDLSDRPYLAERLRQTGLDQAEAGVTAMRQGEVEALAKTFRDEGHEDRARKLWQTWLADRRKNRISASDAEGRVLLAAQYDRWLEDRATAAELLREAETIEPGSKAVTDAFLRLGYRKVEGRWVDPGATTAATAQPAQAPGTAAEAPLVATVGDSIKGLTRGQVRSRLGGKPDRIVRSATQAQAVEQWIYLNGRTSQVINFLVTSQGTEPRAVTYYSMTR